MDANEKEADRWFRQGERDLESARASCRAGNHEWACFQAQQSAEKVLKAILYRRGHRKILTHSVFELVRETGREEASLAALNADAKRLDGVYITARYPDSIVGSLTPAEYFEREDAEACIQSAASIAEAARRTLQG
ncbi:MAG: HEPN domain-containing protein [Methanospirillum sp.]